MILIDNLFDEMPLGRHLAVLTKMYYGALTKRLGNIDIDRQYSTLVLIQKNKQKCTQQYISDTLKIDKASMVGIIDYFVKCGYIIRTPNPSDRREYWLELTPKAKKTMPLINKEIKALNKIAMKGLSISETEILKKGLSTLCANLGQLPTDKISINYKKVNTTKH